MIDIAENIKIIRENIRKVAEKIGKDPKDIIIVAATKTVEPERIEKAIECGIEIIGENRVQEARKKWEVLKNKVKWHMIGHLQTNKVKQALEIFELIHSVDSLKLAKEIQKRAEKMGKIQDILIQVNVSGEKTKFGISEDELIPLVKEVSKFENIRILGLMTIPPYSENPEDSRPYFRRLRELKEELSEKFSNIDFKYLSMGMTNDYLVAIEEGANMVRLGTAIFGPREGK